MLQNDLQCQKLLRVLRNILSFSSTNIFVLGDRHSLSPGEGGSEERSGNGGGPLFITGYIGGL